MERAQAEALVHDWCGNYDEIDGCYITSKEKEALIDKLSDPTLSVDSITNPFFARGAMELARAMEHMHNKQQLDEFSRTYGYDNWPKFVNAILNRAKRMAGNALIIVPNASDDNPQD